MSNLSPVVFAHHGQQFLDAARRESEHSARMVSLPAYFLVGRSIELALKSFLLLQGNTERELKAVSHDLAAALDAAGELNLSSLIVVPPEADQGVRWINNYYETKDLEYPTTGFKSYPPIHYLVAFSEALLIALQPRLRRWRP